MLMKVRKVLSGVMLALGCAAAFVGLLALVLPGAQSQQTQLVVASFSTPSDRLFVSLINRCMTFAFEHALALMLTGLGAALAGGLLLWHFLSRDDETQVSVHAAGGRRRANPNPFAAAVATFEPAEGAREQPSAIPIFSSILEQNPIDPAPSPYARPADVPKPPVKEEPLPEQPATPPPFPPASRQPAEALHVQVPKVEAESQSGSRLLVRSTIGKPDTGSPAPETPLESSAEAPKKPPEIVEEPKPFVSSRIRTTMGKHTL